MEYDWMEYDWMEYNWMKHKWMKHNRIKHSNRHLPKTDFLLLFDYSNGLKWIPLMNWGVILENVYSLLGGVFAATHAVKLHKLIHKLIHLIPQTFWINLILILILI